MNAKDEIGEFTVSTRFGGYKRTRRDAGIERPKSRAEAISQIEAVYSYQGWDERDKTVNAEGLGLEYKPLDDYSNDELKIILTDAEKTGMILYR